MRTGLLLAGVLLVLASAPTSSRADAAPPPTRPSWEDTPLPMPDEPEDVAVLLLAVAGGGLVLAGRARRRRASA